MPPEPTTVCDTAPPWPQRPQRCRWNLTLGHVTPVALEHTAIVRRRDAFPRNGTPPQCSPCLRRRWCAAWRMRTPEIPFTGQGHSVMIAGVAGLHAHSSGMEARQGRDAGTTVARRATRQPGPAPLRSAPGPPRSGIGNNTASTTHVVCSAICLSTSVDIAAVPPPSTTPWKLP